MPVAAHPPLKKRSYLSLPLDKKRVLVRVDYNVPLDKNGGVADDSRIRASLPTLETLIRKKARIILIAHLGRPKGKVNLKYSLKSMVEPLKKLLKVPVHFAEDCIGPKAYEAVAKLKMGEILILENLRFHPEEEQANSVFGKELASLADFFIQDAFGAVHRAHASTSVVPSHMESGAGALLEKELKFLSQIKSQPKKPFLALLGGAKVSDKIGVVESLMDRVDSIFIGGAMAYTFLKAQGHSIGDSRFEQESLGFCKKVFEKARTQSVEFVLPRDHKIVKDIENPAESRLTESEDISQGWKGVDIGPKTIEVLIPLLDKSKTIFWNGPAGIFEIDEFAYGTMEIARLVAEVAKKGASVVVGGGDSVAAVKKAGVDKDITFISTGGGASLEFLEGKDLPGVTALPEA